MLKLLKYLKPGTRSLKTQMAVYFIPVTVLPTIVISFYATRMFQESAQESLKRRAVSERDAIVADIDAYETELFELAKNHAANAALVSALRQHSSNSVAEIIGTFRPSMRIRVYSASGEFLARRPGISGDPQVPYISKEGIGKVRNQTQTLDRYFAQDGRGFLTLVRALIRDKNGIYGILEEESIFGDKELQELKNRRQLDVAFYSRDFNAVASSLSTSKDRLKEIATGAFQPNISGAKDAYITRIGSDRYAGFLYDLPSHFGKVKYWGYVGIFLSMTSVDAMTGRLKVNLILTTLFLILSLALLNFLFSNRIVKPIEILVSAMKRVKTGRVEQIPPIDSAYEIEYLVRAFNDMIRNVSTAKSALEEKLNELKRANQEIKATQTTLVQSAKMISLGQIVAGVAHELNNPIGFIYSNMHHLQEYLEKFRKVVSEYRSMREKLPASEKKALEKMEKELDIDFILKDMDDLTQSCVDGAKRTKDIVLGLRTFSRMDQANQKPEDLHEGIRSTIRLLAAEFKNRITIHEEFGELPLVECSSSQLNQVWMNLFTNAAQAVQGRGDIFIRTSVAGPEVVVEVEDNGMGMSRETLEKIFDPFFTTKKVGQGTGLGLSIAYGLIQKHHGQIHVKSKMGQGTTFTIRLPIQQPKTKAG